MKLINLVIIITFSLIGMYMPLSYAYTYRTTNKTDINPATGQPFVDPISGEIALDPDTGKPYINPWTRQPDIGTEFQIIIPLAATDHMVRSNPIKPGQFEKVHAGGWWSGYCLDDNVHIRPLCNGNPIPQRGLYDCLIFDKNFKVAYYEYKCGINPLGSSFWGMMDYATGGATTIVRMTAQLAGGGGGSNIDVLTFISKSEDISRKAFKNSINLFLFSPRPKKLSDELEYQLKDFKKNLSSAKGELDKATKEQTKAMASKPKSDKDKEKQSQTIAEQSAKVTQAQQNIDPLQQTVNKLEGEMNAIRAGLDKNATAQQKQASSQAVQSVKEAAIHDAVLAARALRLAQGKGLPDSLELDKPVTDNEIKIIEGTIGLSGDNAIKQISAKLDDLIKNMHVKAIAAPTYTCRSLDIDAAEMQAQLVHLGVHLLRKINELKLKEPWDSLSRDPSFIKEWRMDSTDRLYDAAKDVANDFKKLTEKNPIKGGTVINPDVLIEAEKRLRAATDKKSNDDARYLGLRAIDTIKVMAEFAIISAVKTILSLDGKKLPAGVTIGSPPTITERDALHVILPLPKEKIIFFLENIIMKEVSSGNPVIFVAESNVPSIQIAGLTDQGRSNSIYSIIEEIKDLRLISQVSDDLLKAIIKAFPDKKKISSQQVATALASGDYTILETIPNEIVTAIKSAVAAAEGSARGIAVKNQTVVALLGIDVLKSMSKLQIKDPGSLKQWGVSNQQQFIDTLKSTSSKLKKFMDKNKNVGDFALNHDLLDNVAKKLDKADDKNASEDDRFAGLQALDAIRIAAEFSVIMAVKTILILDGKMLKPGTAIASSPTAKEQEALQSALSMSSDKIISLMENTILNEVNDTKPPVLTSDSTSFFNKVKDLATKAKKAYDYYGKVDGFVNNVKKYAQAIQDVVNPSTAEAAAGGGAGAKGTAAVAQETSMMDTVAEMALNKLPDQVSNAIKNAMDEIQGIKSMAESTVEQVINKAKGFATDLANQVVAKVEQSVVGETAKELTAKAAQAIVEKTIKESVTKTVETALKNATEEAEKAGGKLSAQAAQDVTKQALQEAANSAKNIITKVTNNAETAGKIAQAITNVAEQSGRAAGEATGEAVGKAAAEAIGKAAGSAAGEVAAELGAELAAAAALRAVEVATGPIGVLVQLGSMVAVGLAGAFCAAAAFCGDHAMLITRKPGGQMGFNVSIKGAC